jgi:arylsulfatase A-like enzyme
MRFRGAVVAAVAALSVLGVVTPASAASRPNVLIILTDDQPDGTLSVMPDLRRWMVRGGLRFTKAHATTPLCCPARASIMTGRYVHNHLVQDNDRGRLLDEKATIQAYLDGAGYRTGYFGKFLNGWGRSRDPRFFDRFAIMRNPAYRNVSWNDQGQVRESSTYSTTFIRRRLLGFIRGSESDDARPWYAVAAPWAPHSPYEPDTPYENMPVPAFHPDRSYFEADRSDKPPWVRRSTRTVTDARRIRTGQLRTLASVDDLVGATFRTLRDLGETRNTLVFYLSDNGLLWGQHGVTQKRYPYLPSVEIPFLVRWPRELGSGRSIDRLVGNIDVAPTILSAAGIAPTEPMDGRPLFGSGSRDRILLELLSSFEVPMPPWASIRTHRSQYIEHYADDGRIIFREFYRLKADPLQLTNVLRDGNRANDPDVRALHRRLRRMRHCPPGSCP